MVDNLRWVREPDAVCCTSGCQFGTAKRLMMAAQAIIDERRHEVSVYALWCSRGGHSFGEDDPGRIIIPASSALDQEGNEIEIKAQAICGEHARGMNRRLTRPTEISPPRHFDEDYTRKLEKELGITEDQH